VLLLAGTFNLSDIVHAQEGFSWHFLPRWNLLSPTLPQLLGFFCYFTAAVAETNRLPFDLAEAESELVAGYHTEYASFRFAMFFMAEYAAMITVSCLAAILFFGGWLSPFPPGLTWARYLPTALFAIAGIALLIHGVRYITALGRVTLPLLGLALCGIAVLCARPGLIDVAQGPFWFLMKVFIVLFVYVWVRWTLPRFRYDQLMAIGWKLLLPLTIANVVLTSLAVVARK
jgi:NADH-quinone oxidoreductase subunit H